ncbi:MAG: dienelactone hydrolase family protein [Gemmatimonadota bacterium]|nr:dienelactone hydrolase family protein [Gemmatimonadota bacterium]
MIARITSLAAIGLVVAAAVPVSRPADIHGEWVKYAGAGGDSVLAYLAFPERPDPAPAVIVIHENRGMTDWIQTVADSLATAGFVAIAPDLLSRRGGTAAQDDVRRALSGLPPDSITTDLDATYTFLRTVQAVRADAVGVVGFCWGGSQSFRYATNNPALRAAVVCYGSGPNAADVTRIGAPVFGVYGQNDARINAGIPETEQAMAAAGKTYMKTIYPGAGHAFLRTREPAESAAAAWRDIVGFLEKELGR